jgi:hypothetical protein
MERNMKRALTIAIAAICFAAPLSYVTAGSRESMTARAGDLDRARPDEFVPRYFNPYSAAPRIIHVPDADEERASVDSNDWPEDDNADLRTHKAPLRTAPGHRPHPVVKQVKQHQKTPEAMRSAHRRPYSASARAVPPPPVEHRAILSAPPPPIDGPTPIRPTPRFGAPAPTPADQQAQAPAPSSVPNEAQEKDTDTATSPAEPNLPPTEQPDAPAAQ